MTWLHLEGIVCEKTQEAIDEPYLKVIVDEGRITHQSATWGPVIMDDGDARRIDLSKRFLETARIELWERDTVGSDDLIDDLTLSASDTRSGGRSIQLKGHHAIYTLTYAVNPVFTERFELRLVSLKCNDAQESVDQPYLMVNGATVWGPTRMRTRQIQDLSGLDPIDFSRTRNAQIMLWEHDPARSDHIGTHVINEVDARSYATNPDEDRHWVFSRDRGIVGDATYTLTYRVSIAHVPPSPDPDSHP